jgi:hypothetical protein
MRASWSAACAEPPGIDDLRDECVRGPPSPTSGRQCHMSKRVAVGTHPGPPGGTPAYAWVVPAIAGSVRDCLRSSFYDMGRGTVQAGTGCGAEPRVKQIAPQAPPIPSEAWGRPEGGAFTARRARPKRRVGELDASPSAPRSGGAEGAACGQGGNAPGCTSPPGVRERPRPALQR